ncbi:MAG TPA: hypothetical protein VF532_14990 [Candidatus Angelobacter sp.]
MLATLVVCAYAFAQDENEGWLLKFGDYAVKEVFAGKPARPQIVEKNHRTFRTVITEAAAKGPNFAGHYTVAEWGCGSGCMSVAVVDAATGKVFPAPFQILTMPLVTGEDAHEFKGAVYRLRSRLFIADGCQEDKSCSTSYYEWKDDKFEVLRVEPRRGPEQPDDSSEQ